MRKHWKYGISDFQLVVEPYGILNYMTNYKKSNISKERKEYTKFPQFVKIVTHSLDFPVSKKQELVTNKKGLNDIVNYLNNKCKKETGEDLFCYSDGHYYIDYDTGERIYCLDNQYFHKPYIDK